MNSTLKTLALAALAMLALSACTEVGSEAWCQDMQEKPKGDWTANEASDYAKHCIFK
ncbi:hypothetical protein JCM19235_6359 [Vibrio maritimus]|uniref:DUF3012 domain-containing protein n=1 Tax=Vibrio maritimus TaxID=990268 RepID=A0A090RR95_9VIBR|nr:hypothetical protein JCM19235_6359 [Vibrio maritimus]